MTQDYWTILRIGKLGIYYMKTYHRIWIYFDEHGLELPSFKTWTAEGGG